MARIKQPQLPPGPLNDFFTALHELHLKAGQPSTRDLQKDIGRDVVSHATIHNAFSSPRLLGWGMVELLVEVLADKSRQDRGVVTEYFKSLWENAERSLQGRSEPDAGKVRLMAKTVRESIQDQSARPFSEVMSGTLDEIETAGLREIRMGFVPTGFSDADALTGAMRPGQLIVIASRPSIGKSMLLVTMCAKSAILHELPTAVFSTEMTEREIQMRILSAQSRIPYHSIRAGWLQDEDWTRLADWMRRIVDAPLWLSYTPRLNISDLENEAKALAREGRVRLLAVDNIDAIIAASSSPADTIYRLKQLAAELRVPVLVTANMRSSPNVNSDQRPAVNDLWHGELIEAISDILILLHREDAYEPESPRAGEIDLIFIKNRHGPTATITLAFQGHYSRMVDLFVSGESYPAWSVKTTEGAANERAASAPDDHKL